MCSECAIVMSEPPLCHTQTHNSSLNKHESYRLTPAHIPPVQMATVLGISFTYKTYMTKHLCKQKKLNHEHYTQMKEGLESIRQVGGLTQETSFLLYNHSADEWSGSYLAESQALHQGIRVAKITVPIQSHRSRCKSAKKPAQDRALGNTSCVRDAGKGLERHGNQWGRWRCKTALYCPVTKTTNMRSTLNASNSPLSA